MQRGGADIYYHGPVVVFDLDDTLYSEREHAVGAYRMVSELVEFDTPEKRELVLTTMTDALYKRENPFDALVATFADIGSPIRTSIAKLLDTYRSYHPERLTLYPDAKRLLDSLQQAGIRTAIITDGRSKTQRAKIAALGIANYFDPTDILISEETGHDKRKLDNFTAIVHHYPEASRFLYIGDNPAKDFYAPQMLGWDVYCLKEREGNIHPQDIIEDIPIVERLDSIADIINLRN